MSNIGRNDPCHCGSGKKYKKCHLEKDETTDRKEREKAALNAAKVASAASAEGASSASSSSGPASAKPKHQPSPTWIQKVAGKMNFFRGSSQRRAPPANKGG